MSRPSSNLPRATSEAGDNSLLDYPCVEKGIWTPIPRPPPKDTSHRLKLKEVDSGESHTVKQRSAMTFHAVGCSGCFEDPQPGLMIGNAMAAQADNPKVYGGYAKANPASFFYHLGDIAYKVDLADDPAKKSKKEGRDQDALYARQFYAQYDHYQPNIFAIPGNHDSKSAKHDERIAIARFLDNFCKSKRRNNTDGEGNWRKTMIQPYPYWLLETPVAYIIGLATNDINAGPLEAPMGADEPQYQWLLNTLSTIKTENQTRLLEKSVPKAVLLALHYPPFSGSPKFAQRGDPNLGPTPRPSPRNGPLLPLAMILHRAFHQTQQYPDAVLSAHAHLYQRITYTLGSGRQIPYLIAGSGGHGPVEKLAQTCWGKSVAIPSPPFDVILPRGLTIPAGDKAQVVSFNDEDFGFLRLTVDPSARKIVGEFFAAAADSTTLAGNPTRQDLFILDLDHHTIA